MKITQEIKTMDEEELAKIDAVIQLQMDQKSVEFLANDSEIYLKNNG
jgi:phosphomethylpyrimidine synthase